MIQKSELQKLREKTGEELKKELQMSGDNLWKLKSDLAAGKVKNVRQVRNLKKSMAVINTILKEKLNK